MASATQEHAAEHAAAPARALLVVAAGAHTVGVPAAVVVEVARMVAVQSLPGGPATVSGVVGYRGEMAAVLDLGRRLGGQATTPRAADHLVVVAVRERLVALHVDRAVGLVRLDAEEIEGLDGTLAETAHLAGVARGEDGLLVIVDPAAFFGDREAADVDAALARAGDR